MCDWGTEVRLRVPIPASCSYTGKFRWDKKPIDSCISHFVEALNKAGIYTGGSCCGHGKGNGYISLHDGTVLVIERHNPDDMPCASRYPPESQTDEEES